MRYLAKSDPSAAKWPLFGFFAGAILCFFLARVTPVMRWVFDAGIVLCVSAIGYLLYRYVFTSFVYETAGEVFNVYRRTGENEELVFSVSKEMVQRMEKYDPRFEGEEKGAQIHRLCPSLGKNPWRLTARNEGGGAVFLYLECGEEFGEHLKNWINTKKEE